MAMTMAMLTMTVTVMTTVMIDYCLLLESNGIIAAVTYFLFIFNDNAKGEFVVDEANGRREGKSGLIFCNVYGDGDGDGNNNNSDD
jgi:hypothetical protein